ncbi:MAG: LL-diaminopimelate aminotransferase [bacterium]
MSRPHLPRRLRVLPPYPFAEIERKKAQALAAGVDLVDLGVGDPDLPTPEHIVAAMAAAITRPVNHRYPSYRGALPYREAVVRYMQRRFDVTLDAARETLALIGTKEGIAHLALALVNPDDVVLVPDPGYPVYATSAEFLGAEVVSMPLHRDRGFLPRLEDIPSEAAERAALMWLNYPNNPLGGVAGLDFYREVSAFAEEYDLVVASDAAYAEIYLDDTPPVSALQVESLRGRVIEFHSLSKTFNMTGWRIGFAVGTPWIVEALGTVKTNVDSGAFGAIQEAAIAALDGPWEPVEAMRETYRRRGAALVEGLRSAGLDWVETKATFYVVVAVPDGHTSVSYTAELLEQSGIICTPCTAFGPGGEGFVRFSLTASDERIAAATSRLSGLRA